MILRIDPSYGVPELLARVCAGADEKVDFRAEQGRCGRCNLDLREHWWQVIDETTDEQGGVTDCAPASN